MALPSGLFRLTRATWLKKPGALVSKLIAAKGSLAFPPQPFVVPRAMLSCMHLRYMLVIFGLRIFGLGHIGLRSMRAHDQRSCLGSSTSSAAVICRRSGCDGLQHRCRCRTLKEVGRIVAQIRRRWPSTSPLCADSGSARETLMAWCGARPSVGPPFRPGTQPAAGSSNPRRTAAGQPGQSADRQAGAPLQGLRMADARPLEPQPTASSARPGSPAAKPTPRVSSVTSLISPRSPHNVSTKWSTAPVARWRTASRSASSICSPTAPRPRYRQS